MTPTTKKHIVRKFTIIVGSFLLGVASTVFASVTFDVLTISSRATAVINAYKTEAATSTDAKTYYSLARADLALLYKEIDKQLGALAGESTGTTPPVPTCGGTEPTGSGVYKRVTGAAGIQDTVWGYVANNGTYTANDFGSTACKWTCAPGYTKNATENGCTQAVTSECGVDPSPAVVGPATRKCDPATKQWYTDLGCGPDPSPFTMVGQVRKCNPTTKQWYTESTEANACNWDSPVVCGADEFQCTLANAGKTTACHTCLCSGVSTTTYTSDAVLTTKTTSYKKGQKLYGYIEGGDLDNVWACIDIPGSNSCKTNNCSSGYEQGTCPWRQLTKNFTRSNSDPSGKDGWQKNGNRIEFKGGLTIETSWPTGTYTGYTRNGAAGTVIGTTFRIEDGPNPVTVYTDISLSTVKTVFTKGETLYGYIVGGNPDNTWGCIDTPGGNQCSNGAGWRQLTKPYEGTPVDGWQKNPAKGNRIELKDGMMIFPGYPTGIYKGYTRDGLNGVPQVATFEVKEKTLTCSWGATFGPCNPGVCSQSNIGDKACGGTCACN